MVVCVLRLCKWSQPQIAIVHNWKKFSPARVVPSSVASSNKYHKCSRTRSNYVTLRCIQGTVFISNDLKFNNEACMVVKRVNSAAFTVKSRLTSTSTLHILWTRYSTISLEDHDPGDKKIKLLQSSCRQLKGSYQELTKNMTVERNMGSCTSNEGDWKRD